MSRLMNYKHLRIKTLKYYISLIKDIPLPKSYSVGGMTSCYTVNHDYSHLIAFTFTTIQDSMRTAPIYT